jgi:hypothetical protein
VAAGCDVSVSRTAGAEITVLSAGLADEDEAASDSSAGGDANVAAGWLDFRTFAFLLITLTSPATGREGWAADGVMAGTAFEVAAVPVRGRFRSLKNENDGFEGLSDEGEGEGEGEGAGKYEGEGVSSMLAVGPKAWTGDVGLVA